MTYQAQPRADCPQLELHPGRGRHAHLAAPQAAEAREPYVTTRQSSNLDIIEARNQHEEQIAARIEKFRVKMEDFFAYVRTAPEGQRLVVKIKSRLPGEEIYADFGKVYRKYKVFYFRQFCGILQLGPTLTPMSCMNGRAP